MERSHAPDQAEMQVIGHFLCEDALSSPLRDHDYAPPFQTPKAPVPIPREPVQTSIRRGNPTAATPCHGRGEEKAGSVSVKSGHHPGKKAGQPLSTVIGEYCKPRKRFRDQVERILFSLRLARSVISFFPTAVSLTGDLLCPHPHELPSRGILAHRRHVARVQSAAGRMECAIGQNSRYFQPIQATLCLYRRSRFARPSMHALPPRSRRASRCSGRDISPGEGFVGDRLR